MPLTFPSFAAATTGGIGAFIEVESNLSYPPIAS